MGGVSTVWASLQGHSTRVPGNQICFVVFMALWVFEDPRNYKGFSLASMVVAMSGLVAMSGQQAVGHDPASRTRIPEVTRGERHFLET
jgi:hypothetical protein